jgi:para-nitrobenzyl esterase
MDLTRRPPNLRAAWTAACLGLTLVAGAACAQTPSPTPGPSVAARIPQGELAGVDEGEALSFKGIPYAAPPVGNLRWRAPQPAASWTGVRDASAFGADCIQPRPGWDDTQSKQPTSEDCLTLNVWTPEARTTEPLPVIVWIHGGGFIMGSGSQPLFDGARLAARGVVVVTFNYRLGRFGFFAHPALTAEAGDDPTANYGLMDQVAALRWVHDNISALGGDPERVTIMGQSAGGGSVLQLMTMAEARGLFRGAVVQSGGGRDHLPPLTAPAGQRSGESIGQAFAASVNLRNATAADLRALPVERVRGRLDLLNPERNTFTGPIIDGRLVTTQTLDAFMRGEQAPVPLIIGATDFELGSIPSFLRGMVADRTLEDVEVSKSDLMAVYGNSDTLNRAMPSELTFVEPARRLAGLDAAAGRPVWLYSFGYVAQSKRREWSGAPHASDLGYSFDTLGQLKGSYSEADQRIATAMADYWAAFARDGRPDAAGQPEWPRYSPDGDRALLIGESGVSVGPAPEATRLDALGRLRDTTRAAAR